MENIQGLIDNALNNNLGIVEVPPGDYEPVAIYGPLILQGAGFDTVFHSVNDIPAIHVKGPTGDKARYGAVRDLRVQCEDGVGVKLEDATEFEVNADIFGVSKQGIGIELSNSWSNNIIANIHDCATAVRSLSNSNKNSLLGSRIQGNSVGVYVEWSVGLSIAHCLVEGNRSYGIVADNATVQGLTVTNSYFEKNNYYEPAGPQIYLDSNGDGIVIIGNYFNGSSDSTHGVVTLQGSGVIAGNVFRAHTVRDIEIGPDAKNWFVDQAQGPQTPNSILYQAQNGAFNNPGTGWTFRHQVKSPHLQAETGKIISNTGHLEVGTTDQTNPRVPFLVSRNDNPVFKLGIEKTTSAPKKNDIIFYVVNDTETIEAMRLKNSDGKIILKNGIGIDFLGAAVENDNLVGRLPVYDLNGNVRLGYIHLYQE